MSLRHAPAAARSAGPLLALMLRLRPGPARARLLELGSGTGEHAALLAARLPWMTWQPSDPDEAARASTAAWTARAGARNVLPPLHLDLMAPSWRLRACDLLLAVHVLHVAPPGATEALLAGAAEVLSPGGLLVVAGPFRGEVPGVDRPDLPALLDRARALALWPVAEAPFPGGARAVALRRCQGLAPGPAAVREAGLR